MKISSKKPRFMGKFFKSNSNKKATKESPAIQDKPDPDEDARDLPEDHEPAQLEMEDEERVSEREAPKEDVLKAIEMAKESCKQIYEVQRNALKAKYNNGGNQK